MLHTVYYSRNVVTLTTLILFFFQAYFTNIKDFLKMNSNLFFLVCAHQLLIYS